MKELWTANPFCLMNRPFAEMGYNSSGLNIAPERLLLATRRPSMHHPLASGEASFNPPCAPPADAPQTICNTRHNIWRPPQAICRRSAQHLAAPCTASAISPQTIRHLAARHPLPCAASVGSLQAICPPAHRAMPAGPSQAIRHRTAQHSPSRRKPSAISLRAILRPPRVIRWHPAGNLPARTDALNGPQNKPSAQAGALNPRKNTFCVIVNCPLQIKPVFYFLFTSIASPAHRIRVKSSLLRLGRSCLALPFTHLGKDIT